MLTTAILNKSMVRDSDLIGVALFPYTSGLPMGTFSKQGAMFASSDPSEFMSSFLPAAHAPSFDSSQWLQMGSSKISKSSRRWISVLQAFETTRASKNKCLPKPKHAKAVSNGPRFHLECPCSQMPLQQVFLRFLKISSMRSCNLRANVSCLNALTKLQKAPFFSNSFGLRHRSAPPQSRRPIEKLKIPIGPIYGEITGQPAILAMLLHISCEASFFYDWRHLHGLCIVVGVVSSLVIQLLPHNTRLKPGT